MPASSAPRDRLQRPLGDLDVDGGVGQVWHVRDSWDRLAYDVRDQRLEPVDHTREQRRALGALGEPYGHREPGQRVLVDGELGGSRISSRNVGAFLIMVAFTSAGSWLSQAPGPNAISSTNWRAAPS